MAIADKEMVARLMKAFEEKGFTVDPLPANTIVVDYFAGGPKFPTQEEAAAIDAARVNRASLPTTKCGQPILLEKEVDGKLRRFVSCGNTHDPNKPETEKRMTFGRDDDFRTPAEREADEQRWLSKMVLANPLPNEHYTTAQLLAMDLMGIFMWEDVPEDEQVKPDVVIGQ